jgi:hypothetical protein
LDQIVQVLGSMLILVAFAGAQRGWLSAHSPWYLALNLVGASVLAVLAARDHQLGFLLLEFSWALVAGYSLLAGRRGSRQARRGGAGSRQAAGTASSQSLGQVAGARVETRLSPLLTNARQTQSGRTSAPHSLIRGESWRDAEAAW